MTPAGTNGNDHGENGETKHKIKLSFGPTKKNTAKKEYVGDTGTQREQRVRLELPVRGETFNPAPIVRALLPKMKAADPHLILKGWKAKAKDINVFNDIAKNEEEFFTYFQHMMNTKTGRAPQHCIFFDIASRRTIGYIKHELFGYLRETGLWLHAHEWNKLEITEIGVLMEVHPTITNFKDLKPKIINTLTKLNDGEPDDFKIYKALKGFGDNDRVVTEVIAVQCETDNAKTMKEMFMHPDYYKETGHRFVPAGAPQAIGVEAYKALLRAQNSHLNNTVTIPVVGLGHEAFDLAFDDGMTVKDALLHGLNGQCNDKNFEIHSTMKKEEHGRYLFACRREDLDTLRRHIDGVFAFLYEQINDMDPDGHTDLHTKFVHQNYEWPRRTDRPNPTARFTQTTEDLKAAFSNPQDAPEKQGDPEPARKKRAYGANFSQPNAWGDPNKKQQPPQKITQDQSTKPTQVSDPNGNHQSGIEMLLEKFTTMEKSLVAQFKTEMEPIKDDVSELRKQQADQNKRLSETEENFQHMAVLVEDMKTELEKIRGDNDQKSQNTTSDDEMFQDTSMEEEPKPEK